MSRRIRRRPITLAALAIMWGLVGCSADESSRASVGKMDIEGVNLAAIKALEQRTSELRATRATLDERTRRLEQLERRVAQLENGPQMNGEQQSQRLTDGRLGAHFVLPERRGGILFP